MVKENNGQGRSTILRRRWIVGGLILLSLLGAIVKTVSRLSGGTTKALPTKKAGATNPAALYDSHHPQERAILEGKYFLVDIDVSFGALSENIKPSSNTNKTHHYGSVSATFCPIDWRLQKTNPSTVPMFRALVSQSKHCQPNRVTMDLREIVKKVRLYDKAMAGAALKKKPTTTAVKATVAHAVATAPHLVSTSVKTLQLGGFVFHESRCGSTLVSNLLVASNPKAHRVYSESGPPITALRACGNIGESLSCSAAKQTALLQDVIFLMSRSPAKEETHVFFKIQSVGAHSMAALTSRAFPTTPWIFVYRDPVEVLMSHLKHGGDAAKKAVCLRSKGRAPPNLVQLVHTKNRELSKLSNVEYCAAHLATLCQSALKEYHHDDNVDVDHPEVMSKKDAANNNNKLAKMVNYASLPDIMWESILPDHFDIDVPGETQEMVERMKTISQVYSKGFKGDQPWEQDSERKQSEATAAMKKAATIFLDSYFDQMEATNNNSRNDGDDNTGNNEEDEAVNAGEVTDEKKEEEDREPTDEEREEREVAAVEAENQ